MKTIKFLIVAMLFGVFISCEKPTTIAPAYGSEGKFDLTHKTHAAHIISPPPPLTINPLKIRVLVSLFGQSALSKNCQVITICSAYALFNGNYDTLKICVHPKSYTAHTLKQTATLGLIDTVGSKLVTYEVDTVITIPVPKNTNGWAILINGGQLPNLTYPALSLYGYFQVTNVLPTTFFKEGEDVSMYNYQKDSCSIAGVNMYKSKLAGSTNTLTIFVP